MSSPTISVQLQQDVYDFIKTSPRSLNPYHLRGEWKSTKGKKYEWSDETVKLAKLYQIQLYYMEMNGC